MNAQRPGAKSVPPPGSRVTSSSTTCSRQMEFRSTARSSTRGSTPCGIRMRTANAASSPSARGTSRRVPGGPTSCGRATWSSPLFRRGALARRIPCLLRDLHLSVALEDKLRRAGRDGRPPAAPGTLRRGQDRPEKSRGSPEGYRESVKQRHGSRGKAVQPWVRVLAVNLYGAFHAIRACLPPMIDRPRVGGGSSP